MLADILKMHFSSWLPARGRAWSSLLGWRREAAPGACSCPAPPGAFIPERLGREDAQRLSTCWDARWFGFVAENPASQPCCEIFRDLVEERVMFSAPFFLSGAAASFECGADPGLVAEENISC